uniref:DIX domain containing 1 n=1 Tax=Mus musculus TaxID=10090 RepID=F2Z453_MOUSE
MLACLTRGNLLDVLQEGFNEQQLQAYVAWVNAQLKKRPSVKPVQDLRQDLRDGVILAYLIEIVGQLALDSDASVDERTDFFLLHSPFKAGCSFFRMHGNSVGKYLKVLALVNLRVGQ